MGGTGGTAGTPLSGGSRAERYIDHVVDEAVASHRPICLDSPPLIIYVAGKGLVADVVERLLSAPLVMVITSTVALAEVITGPAMARDFDLVEAVTTRLRSLPRFHTIDFDERHALEAAFVRAETGLKLPDAAIVATARLANAAALIGNDRQWRHKPLGLPYHHLDVILTW